MGILDLSRSYSLLHARNRFAISFPLTGEMGFFRIELGRNLLGVEENFAWATPKTWTTHGDGDCHDTYIDPSFDIAAVHLAKQ